MFPHIPETVWVMIESTDTEKMHRCRQRKELVAILSFWRKLHMWRQVCSCIWMFCCNVKSALLANKHSNYVWCPFEQDFFTRRSHPCYALEIRLSLLSRHWPAKWTSTRCVCVSDVSADTRHGHVIQHSRAQLVCEYAVLLWCWQSKTTETDIQDGPTYQSSRLQVYSNLSGVSSMHRCRENTRMVCLL